MTIVVTLRVDGGIVLAADSATSFFRPDGAIFKVYNNENKIFNLVRGHSIGAMTYGNGAIGKASISSLSKDFRIRLTDEKSKYYINVHTYTLEEVAKKAKMFFEEAFLKANPDGINGYLMGYRICGYSSGAALPESWEILLKDKSCSDPVAMYGADDYGPRWAGTTEAIDRLLLGVDPKFEQILVGMGIETAAARDLYLDVVKQAYATVYIPAMPIQDAVNVARFLADTAARFSEFRLQAPTVGGPIEIATITKHEGFKWVSRKHYYSKEFNRGDTDHVKELQAE